MRRPLSRVIVAAAGLALVAILLFAPGQQSTAKAFNKIAEKVMVAKSARYQMEISIEGQEKLQAKAYYLAPGRYRRPGSGRKETLLP